MDQKVRFAAIGCPHAPLQDNNAVSDACDIIAKFRPHYMFVLGDLFEAKSASRWPNEYDWSLNKEYKHACQKVLLPLRKASPKARHLFLPGNHDDNMLAIGRLPRDIRENCDWSLPQYARVKGQAVCVNTELLDHWAVPTQYLNCRRRGVYRIGQVTFGHGYKEGVNADAEEAILLGVPFGLWVGAHTHQPMPVAQVQKTRRIPLPYWYANTGCLRHLKPDYVRRKDTHLWGHAVVLGEADSSIRLCPERRWWAETRIIRMYDEWTRNRRHVI